MYLPSLDETPDAVLTGDKLLKTISASIFLGDIVSVKDNAGFASYDSLLTPDTFNLLNYRVYTQTNGTDVFITSVRLGEEEFGTFQPGFNETRTISGDETIEAVFVQQQDAFNYAHIFRGTEGKITFDLFVDSQRRDLAPDLFTDAQLLAIPDEELLRLVNSNADVRKPADFDNPDDPPNDADTLVYKNARNFEVGRKLIIKWRSDDGNTVTVKGDTIGGNFIPFFQTFFADRLLDREYPDRHLTVDEETEIDAPFANVLLDPTVASFDLTLIDATEIVGAQIVFKKLEGTPNTVTLIPQAGQTIEGASSYTLSGDLGAAVTLFSDGTTDLKIISTFLTYANGVMGFLDNTTETVIATVDTYVDIGGTIVAGLSNENLTLSNGVLTYTGTKTEKFVVSVNISLKKAQGASARTVRAALFTDTGSGFVENGSAPLDMDNAIKSFGFMGIQSLSTGDDMKIMIKNETNTDNILIVTYDFVVFQA